VVAAADMAAAAAVVATSRSLLIAVSKIELKTLPGSARKGFTFLEDGEGISRRGAEPAEIERHGASRRFYSGLRTD
jgi:hypothetical protein